MAESWATFGVDLHLEPAGPGLRRGLTDALRDAVRTGRLAPGTRLPSSRALAADLGIARNTVADAYADLVAEGWLTARQGSGTRVAERRVVPSAGTVRRPRERGRPEYDLRPGWPDLASFPRTEWLRAARRALAAAPNDALGYGDPHGRPELRTALAGYLSRVRGVRADPERILVCGGISHGLRILGAVLRARGVSTVAVESYGLRAHWDILEGAGLHTASLPYDELGTDPRALVHGWGGVPPTPHRGAGGVHMRLRRAGATGHRSPADDERPTAAPPAEHPGAVLLTPAHQFPMGVPLHRDRRAALVDWARRAGGLVLEDDYDGEFRYDRQPVGALQGLDPDRVVYLGTASKSLAPGLRLAWLVLPPALVEEATAEKGGVDTCGALDQLTLAEFLTSGAYDRHVRAARLRYRRRRDALVAALAERAPQVSATGIAAGLHAVLRLPPGTEQSVVQAAHWQDLAVHGLTRYRRPDALVEPLDALVVGYGRPPDHGWSGALDALCATLP
ncbi:GntR family transcriptional regulator [Streptomyces viridochromogenes]|uniref:GntR family transcriptional regulator n=1 Tax=Streptomyces viridochromogenes TaxID=1938 RepID=A0A0J7YV38_STRVR|nr:PLP-dependent aminotransferase family protein [Streptomyces viridochromogenes]KMS67501.1 GntR family transcriptional regulator [Streptomyces viridochromogenes]KOG24567.1 GntR family transcriptional regulator [Streptomyces viridochromogenes]KOG29152.1 GntR family transcriptional regulator [Streptomyces viridochromogenes]